MKKEAKKLAAEKKGEKGGRKKGKNDGRDGRDERDSRDGRGGKYGRGGKDGRDGRDGRDGKNDAKYGGKKSRGKKDKEGNREEERDDKIDRDNQKGYESDEIEVKNLHLVRGYFDEALEKMARLRNSKNEALRFNSEFQKMDTKPADRDLLKAGCKTTRGHVTFNFISPGDKELKGLSKFFAEHTNTRGSVGELTENDM